MKIGYPVEEKLKYHQDEAKLILALQKYASTMGENEMRHLEEGPRPDSSMLDTVLAHDQQNRRLKRGLQRGVNILAACMVLVIVGCISAFICSAEFREFLYDKIISFGDGYLSFYGDSSFPEGMIQPTYLPIDFTIVGCRSDKNGEIHLVNFQNGLGEVFTILQEKGNSNNIYDYEQDIPSDAEIVMVGNTEGYYWRREDINTLVWLQGGYFHSIAGRIEKAEMLRIAESIPT